MISIVTIGTESKQDMANATIPEWLKQRDVDFEIVVVTDNITVPNDKRIRVIRPGTPFDFIKWYNLGFKEAKGDIIVITQIDMEVNHDHLLLNMSNKLKPGHMVSERFFKNDRRVSGIFCQMLMLWKKDLLEVGGYHEGFCGLCAWEDNDLMSALMEHGVMLDLISFDEEYATHHLWHPVNYDSPESKVLQDKAKAVFESRFKRSLLQTYGRQYVIRKKYGDEIAKEML